MGTHDDWHSCGASTLWIYIVMAASTFVLVYAGLTGSRGWWLWVALALLGTETVVFVGNGMRCPLTALAVSYGAEKGYAFDTFLPERVTRHTFRFFGSLMLLGLVCVAVGGRVLDQEVTCVGYGSGFLFRVPGLGFPVPGSFSVPRVPGAKCGAPDLGPSLQWSLPRTWNSEPRNPEPLTPEEPGTK